MTAIAERAQLTPTGVLVTDAEPESPSWFAARREGITGTDLPKLLGDSRYGNALSVWLDKRGELPADTLGEAGQWGHELEEPVARVWARRHGVDVTPIGVLAHAEHPWRRASLDRLVTTCPDGDGPCGLEVKTRSAYLAGRYRDDVPDDVLAQVAWGRHVSGLHHMHVAVLLGGQAMVTHRVDADADLEGHLIAAAQAVWDAVEAGVPPVVDADGDGVLLGLLNQLYGKRDGALDLDERADEVEGGLAAYTAASRQAKAAEAAKTAAKTELVALLEGACVGVLDGAVRFTYRRPAPGVAMLTPALKHLARERPETYADLADAGFITPTDPAPRFLVVPVKEG